MRRKGTAIMCKLKMCKCESCHKSAKTGVVVPLHMVSYRFIPARIK